MEILLGAPACLTPLGPDLPTTLAAMRAGTSALLPSPFPGSEKPVHVGRVDDVWLTGSGRRSQRMIGRVVRHTLTRLTRNLRTEPRTCFILATTKGDVKALEQGRPEDTMLPVFAARMGAAQGFSGQPIVVSSACISGTLAIKFAADLIALGEFDHALVVGFDEASDFVLSGFLALHAMATEGCEPFDDARDGISLGEASASVVLSRDRSLFQEGAVAEYVGGGMGNDANHISGPSRTGEGLVRAVEAALDSAGLTASDVGHVNAHGTGSVYNDGMEAIAFGRLGLGHAPVNSYKGYFGHTLGTAGLVEALIAVEALRQGILLRSLGATNTTAMPDMDILKENRDTSRDLLLKTSSGFGGCNAAVLLRALRS